MVAVRENHPDVVKLLLDARRARQRARPGPARRRAWVLPNSVPGFGHGVGIVRGGLPDARLARADSRRAVAAACTRRATAGSRSRDAAARRRRRHQPDRRQRHHAADHGDHEQPRRRRAVPDRARRRHQGASTGTAARRCGRRSKRATWTWTTRTFVNSIDRAPFLELIKVLLERGADPNVADEGSAADPPARSCASPARWRGWTSPARRRS